MNSGQTCSAGRETEQLETKLAQSTSVKTGEHADIVSDFSHPDSYTSHPDSYTISKPILTSETSSDGIR